MFVKPAPGLIVRDPFTKRPLPSSGCEVPETTYWVRAIASGDVLVIDNNQIPEPESQE